MPSFTLTVNDRPHVVNVAADTPLLWVLRDNLGLTGTKFGCGIAQCGACTVHLDGEATRSCVIPISAVGAAKVTTIEALSPMATIDAAMTNICRCGTYQRIRSAVHRAAKEA